MNIHLELFFNWLINRSLQAGVLVLFVLLVQTAFRRQLTNRWRFAIWWILILRLALPVGPKSAASLFNFVRPSVAVEGPRYFVPTTADNSLPPNAGIAMTHAEVSVAPIQNQPAISTPVSESAVLPTTQSTPLPAASAPVIIPHHARDFQDYLIPALVGVWLAGVLGLGGYVTIQFLRFRRQLSGYIAPASEDLRELLEECRKEFHLGRRVELLETDAVGSPALCGPLRLRLLLPRGLAGKFTRQELRYIFLHELAHAKRGDLWLNWLVTGLQIMHWFNPLVWLGFGRLRADRELACDELALVTMGENKGTAYGATIVKLLEGLSRPRTIPGLVGILEDKKLVRRRISMIAGFRKPGRWSALAVILLGMVGVVALTDAQSGKPAARPATQATAENDATSPDLTGMVHAKGGGPLEATVFIDTAAPKTGTSTFCPSCYADCRKSAKADASGNFKIDALDPRLTFQVLAVAKGYKPKYANKVDPMSGTLQIELDPIEAADAPADRSLRGRVVNAKGEPLEGAVVATRGIRSKNGSGTFGRIAGIDPLAVTDGNGEFLITSKQPLDMVDVEVSAHGYAPSHFTELSNDKANQLVMTEGATVTGRVMAGGKPLGDVVVGISGADRQAGQYHGHFEVGTDIDGSFALVNVPPDRDFYIYGTMDGLKGNAIPIQTIHTGRDGETTKAGNLVVGPAHRLAGRVALADGTAIPANTRLLVSRDQAWDSTQIVLGPDGSFDVSGIPSEQVTLNVRVNGYRLSGQNGSLDPLNPNLVGRVDHDITNLMILMEKGPTLRADFNSSLPESEWPQNRPLRGAEGGSDHSREWTISGHVLDSETRQPIASFRVTPGEPDNIDQMSWDTIHAVDGTDGAYTAHISKHYTQPQLMAEADGYLPASVALLSKDAANVDILLTKGSGPAGTVLSPDGTPAAGTVLVVLTGKFNQAFLNPDRGLNAMFPNRGGQVEADAGGHFSFKPRLDSKSVVAASSNGFALVTLETLAANPVIQLGAYGRVTGTLQRASGPGMNEQLDLTFADANAGQKGLNMSVTAKTDAQGRFEFDHVPPGRLAISSREYNIPGPGINTQSWNRQMLKEFDLPPGQSLELNVQTTDRPAPEPSRFTAQPPEPKRIPGGEIKGVVIGPDGKPAADAEVALRVEGKYLMLGKGTFVGGTQRQDGLLVNTAADGSFTLPLYERADSVVAVTDDGFAQVSLEQLKASSQIVLQKCGTIEGTLRSGHHPATNDVVMLMHEGQRGLMGGRGASPDGFVPLMYDMRSFSVQTDGQGRFAFGFVPPGRQKLAKRVALGGGTTTSSPLTTVEIKPGETTQVTVGGNGRSIIGRIKFTDEPALDFTSGFARITTPMSKLIQKTSQLKTDAERQAFYASDEFQAATENARSFGLTLSTDGTFRADDIPPGHYEITFEPKRMDFSNHEMITMLTSTQEVVVAESNADDDSPADLGTVEIKKFTLPVPQMSAAGKPGQ